MHAVAFDRKDAAALSRSAHAVVVFAPPQVGEPGGIIDKAMPLDISNVLVFNPKSKKGERVGFRVEDDGSKVRVFRGTGDVVDI